MLNKRGQIAGVILAVVTLFVVAVILIFMNTLNKEVYDKFDKYMNESPSYNGTEAHDVVQKLQKVESGRIWDYVFLAVFIGMLLQMIVLAFASRTNVLFFWIYVILALVILVIGTVLSNIWQEVALQPAFTETMTRFTITNTILGTYYPTIITAFVFLGMIFIFGKFPGQTEGE
ncbi:MAG: hypothetical protein IMZ60_00170 [Actinobacteria bacterium]|nr:hypothetical protein [Actinomycetota bacterium]